MYHRVLYYGDESMGVLEFVVMLTIFEWSFVTFQLCALLIWLKF